MQEWVAKELEASDIGDDRLDERYKLLMDDLSRKPSLSIPAACGGWTETIAAYRFFDNRRVDERCVLQPHRDATLTRIREHKVALLIQDTTALDVTRPEQQMQGAGPLDDEWHFGFYDHVLFAVTPDRVPLGVVDAQTWARDMETFLENKKLSKAAKEKKRKQTPVEDKESFRWVEGYRQACAVAAQTPDTMIVCISDSEGDVYDCFAEAIREDRSVKAQWIVRACQDRSLPEAAEHGHGYQKLWEEVSQTKIRGTLKVEVSKNRPKSQDDRKRRQPRTARTATVTVQAKRVTLKAPWRPDGQLPDVEVKAILVREVNPPQGEEPIEWLLLTSLPISSFAKIRLVIDYYCCRWQIEIYFRVLKSGCKVEERQLETAERYLPCLALYMIIAWRVMYVMMLGRQCPDMPCDAVLSEDEWKAVYVIVKNEEPPQESPTLNTMIYLIARLGGYLDRANDGPPGPKTMWIGMQRMMDFAQAWRAFRPQANAVRGRKIRV